MINTLLNQQFPFFWLETQWNQLCNLAIEQKLHHALLIHGQRGLGKMIFSRHFAKFLLCEDKLKVSLACGKCSSCHLFEAGTHPDFIFIAPEEKGKAIKIDSIRQLESHSHESATRGGAKVVLIHFAEAMNINAANALLKVLEEPSHRYYYFILVTDEALQLTATIRSRLFKIQCAPLQKNRICYC